MLVLTDNEASKLNILNKSKDITSSNILILFDFFVNKLIYNDSTIIKLHLY